MVCCARNAGEKKRLKQENGKLATVLEEFQSMCFYLDEFILRIICSEDRGRDFSLSFSHWNFHKHSLYVDCSQCWFLAVVCFNGSVVGKEQLARASGKDKLVRTSVRLVSPFIDTTWLYIMRTLHVLDTMKSITLLLSYMKEKYNFDNHKSYIILGYFCFDNLGLYTIQKLQT